MAAQFLSDFQLSFRVQSWHGHTQGEKFQRLIAVFLCLSDPHQGLCGEKPFRCSVMQGAGKSP
jgi:hypothetical protein